MKVSFHYQVSLLLFGLYSFNSNSQPIGTAIIHDRITVTDSTITGFRMRLNTIRSECDSPKINCPGYFGNTGVYYKSYCFTNESANSECIKVKMQMNCAAQFFCAAYEGAFDPSDVCVNYLADPGLSMANGASDSISFTIGPGMRYCIVVSGISMGDTCDSYTLKISQFATSWHGSISNDDSTQTQRIHLDNVRYTCEAPKQLCTVPPAAGFVRHDGYLYNNSTPNDICLRVKLFNNSTNNADTITSVAYLNNCNSTNVCHNLASDPGIGIAGNDSLWYTVLVPSGSNSIIVVYSQNDSALCEDYKIKVEADFTMGIEESSYAASSLTVFPNPVIEGNNLNVRMVNDAGVTIEFLDITGRSVLHKAVDSSQNAITIPTSGFTAGVYLLRISGELKTYTQKIIVQ